MRAVKTATMLERRSLLQSGAALTAAALAGRAAPTDRVRVGFIGLGRMGQGNLRTCQKLPDFEVAALCDVYKPNLDQAAAMAPGAKTYADFRELLAARDIDAVCIDRKSTRLNSSHIQKSRMPSSA